LKKFFKPFYRGNLSNLQPLREGFFHLFKKNFINKYLIIKLKACNCLLLIDTSDSWGIDVLRSGRVETPEDEFVKKVLKKGSTVLDIGAHWGGFTVLFASLVGNNGEVLSFEPSKRNFKFLNRNIKINNFCDIVKPYNYAIGNENKTVKLGIAKTSSGHNSILNENLEVNRYEEVKQIKLDDFLVEKGINKVDFIKIDVEGYELEVLEGLENTIENSSNLWMFIEFVYRILTKFYGKRKKFKIIRFSKTKF